MSEKNINVTLRNEDDETLYYFFFQSATGDGSRNILSNSASRFETTVASSGKLIVSRSNYYDSPPDNSAAVRFNLTNNESFSIEVLPLVSTPQPSAGSTQYEAVAKDIYNQYPEVTSEIFLPDPSTNTEPPWTVESGRIKLINVPDGTPLTVRKLA
ncbi:hypothetical protein LZ023_30265 [Pseudomonas silvicola]|nr:hypothetical protein LZ023_30265 [Pseudomonas silvicola]